MRFGLLLAGALLAAPVTIAAAPDWTTTIAQTATGSYVRGNPQAKVKLVEYISFTCDHCARFYAASAAPLAARIRTGNTSVELRHAVRDPLDLTASLLARCAGPKRFYGHARAILAAQPEWLAKGAAWQDANIEPMKTMSVGQRLQGYGAGSGLIALMKTRGLPEAAARKCLADTAQHQALSAMAKASFAAISGTPSFSINGAVAPRVHDWTRLEPLLAAADAQ